MPSSSVLLNLVLVMVMVVQVLDSYMLTKYLDPFGDGLYRDVGIHIGMQELMKTCRV